MGSAKIVGFIPGIMQLKSACPKQSFSTPQEAYKALENMKDRGHLTKRKSTYYCEECKAFHVTSSKNRRA